MIDNKYQKYNIAIIYLLEILFINLQAILFYLI